MNNPTCDKCNQEFAIDLQTEFIGDTQKTYFICPHCQEEYIAFCIDPNIKEMQHKLNLLYDNLKSAKTVKQARTAGKKVKKMRKEIKKEMDLLKDEFVG